MNGRRFRPVWPLTGNCFCYGRVGCLDENTKIDVVKDNKVTEIRLKDLPDRFQVLSYNFNHNDGKKIVTSEAIKIDSGEKECYEITGQYNRKIIATADHIFFDMKGKEIKVKDIKPGMNIFNKARPVYNRNSFAKPDSVKKIQEKRKKYIGNPTEAMKNGFKSCGEKASIRYSGKGNCWSRPDVIAKIKKTRQRPEIKAKIRASLSGKNNPMYGKVGYPKPRYVEQLKHKIRSSWEEQVCLKLQDFCIDYEYEPDCFKLEIDNKQCSYTPDMKITINSKVYYIEVKGPLFEAQYQKMLELEKHVNFIVISGSSYQKLIDNFENHIDYYTFINIMTKQEFLKNVN